jgi:hypothetical protein
LKINDNYGYKIQKYKHDLALNYTINVFHRPRFLKNNLCACKHHSIIWKWAAVNTLKPVVKEPEQTQCTKRLTAD